ncbi:MAG: hypothetical protein WCT77_11075 [Bacteroidota bacterium]
MLIKQDSSMDEQLIRNVLHDTRQKIKYLIYSKRILTKEEMLQEIRKFNFSPSNIGQNTGATVEIYAEE